jgi:hypothetical protein
MIYILFRSSVRFGTRRSTGHASRPVDGLCASGIDLCRRQDFRRVAVPSDEDRQPPRAAGLPRYGPGRGIRFGRPASAVRVGAVVRDTEEELAVMGWEVLPNRGMLRAPPGAAGGDERAFRGSRCYTLADLLAQQILAGSLGLLSASPPRCERGPEHDTPWMTSLSPGRSTFSPSSSGPAVLRW